MDEVISLGHVYGVSVFMIFRFVLKLCERGKGLKPDWAAKGIEFLCFASDPKVTSFLSDDEFMVCYTYTRH